MNIRRALLAASTAAVLAVPAVSAAPTSAQDGEIVECRVTFLIGPVMCKVENTQQQISDDPPVVECSVTFVLGPLQCRAEREIGAATDPDNF